MFSFSSIFPVGTISAWLRTAERLLPQRARQLYPTLNEDDLQWPELMDFRRETKTVLAPE